MEPISMILSSALGFIFKAASETQLVKTAENDLLSKFWHWIKPHFAKEAPAIETSPNSPETLTETEKRLVELVKNEDFFKELTAQVNELKKAGIKEKNIVKADLKNIKTIIIGDKTYSPDEHYDRKNIFEGKAEGVDTFIVGEGH